MNGSKANTGACGLFAPACRKRLLGSTALALALMAGGAGIANHVHSAVAEGAAPAVMGHLESFAPLVERVKPMVVTVETTGMAEQVAMTDCSSSELPRKPPRARCI